MGRRTGRGPPKVLGLSEFLEEHGGEVECDLQRVYGLNLVEDIGSPALTWRRLELFIRDLLQKTDSSLARSYMTPDERPWATLESHLMALVADRLGVSNWLAGQGLVARGVYKENPVPLPEPLPRPGVATPEPTRRGLKAVIRKLFPKDALKAGI